MKLQTNIPITIQRHNQITYQSKVFSIGSCFAQHIGHKLNYFKFQNIINPFGILFHPMAIETCITNIINEKIFSSDDLFFHLERYHSFDVHSEMSQSDQNVMLKNLNKSIAESHSFLKTATHLIITLGTAWVYRHIETDSYVANCHKIPQKKFLKELLSIQEILESLEATVNLVKSINPEVQFIFTVSPVRHIKDGFVENSRSKAHLISAIHDLMEQDAKSCLYFPSYEIMMDELRDYRFYNDDMLHPSNTAVQYIWEHFKSSWLAPKCLSTMENIDKIQRGLQHRPFNSTSKAHLDFLAKIDDLKSGVSSQFPHITF